MLTKEKLIASPWSSQDIYSDLILRPQHSCAVQLQELQIPAECPGVPASSLPNNCLRLAWPGALDLRNPASLVIWTLISVFLTPVSVGREASASPILVTSASVPLVLGQERIWWPHPWQSQDTVTQFWGHYLVPTGLRRHSASCKIALLVVMCQKDSEDSLIIWFEHCPRALPLDSQESKVSIALKTIQIYWLECNWSGVNKFNLCCTNPWRIILPPNNRF